MKQHASSHMECYRSISGDDYDYSHRHDHCVPTIGEKKAKIQSIALGSDMESIHKESEHGIMCNDAATTRFRFRREIIFNKLILENIFVHLHCFSRSKAFHSFTFV